MKPKFVPPIAKFPLAEIITKLECAIGETRILQSILYKKNVIILFSKIDIIYFKVQL